MSIEQLDMVNNHETGEAERQLVAFRVGQEVYGVDIAHIHTIITPQPITFVPRAPRFVKGIMNLRGRVLPVIDLRRRFGLEPLAEADEKHSRIVIVDVDGLSAGLIVDAVSEVLRLRSDHIDEPSQLVASVETECITGIGRVGGGPAAEGAKSSNVDHLIILLDVYKTLITCTQDAKAIEHLQKAA
jgi:purine-binding chemotaxis protein CheW